MLIFRRLALLLPICVLFAACNSSNLSTTPTANPTLPPTPAPGPPLGKYIKHIVVIVQENRSFEVMFAGWPGADAPMTGYGTINGKRTAIPLQQITYSDAHDICHLWADAHVAVDGGKMDGFNLERQDAGAGGCPPGSHIGNYPYSYLDHTEIAPYRTLASQYVLADHMFPTEFGTSFTAHQDLIAGTTQIDPGHSLVNTPTNFPWGCDAPHGTTTPLVNVKGVIFPNGPFPCFTQYPTIADSLDARGVDWRYYAPTLSPATGGAMWTAFDAIKKVRYGKDWAKVIVPETKALSDFSKGDAPSVSWVIPDLAWADYPLINTDEGPSWVGDLVNAIGKSKDWNTTAVVVLWDDWGGFYDDAAPPQLDYVGLAIRVPCLIISPYAKRGTVVHTQYEYGSVLKFIEQAFDADSLHSTDQRANSLVDSFDFTQKPRAYTPVATKYPPSFFLQQPSSNQPPDDQ